MSPNPPDQEAAAARGTAADQRGVNQKGISNAATAGNAATRGTLPIAPNPHATPSIPMRTLSTSNLRPLVDLPDAAFRRAIAENVTRETPFVVNVPATPLAKTANEFLAQLRAGEPRGAASYLVWAEKGRVRGWVPISEVPNGPSRSDDGRWWVWSDGRQVQVAERYSQNPAEVAARIAKQTPWERAVGVQGKADARDVRRQVDAGTELNRDIEKYLTGGSMDPRTKKPLPPMALDQARSKTLQAHKDVLEVMVVGTALIFSSPMEPVTPQTKPLGATRTRLGGSRVSSTAAQLAENGLHETPIAREVSPAPQRPAAQQPTAQRPARPGPGDPAFADVEVPRDFDPNKARGTAADFQPPSRMPPGSQSSVPFVESRGASAGKESVFQSASASTEKALATAIRPDVAESQVYMVALRKGEIGLQRPLGANVGGADMITAVRRPDGTLRVIVTDVASTTTGRINKGPPVLKAKWLAEVQDAVSSRRLDLGNAGLEAEIQMAVARGDVEVRIVSVDYARNAVMSGL